MTSSAASERRAAIRGLPEEHKTESTVAAIASSFNLSDDGDGVPCGHICLRKMPFNEKGLLAKNSEAYYAAFYGTTRHPWCTFPCTKPRRSFPPTSTIKPEEIFHDLHLTAGIQLFGSLRLRALQPSCKDCKEGGGILNSY